MKVQMMAPSPSMRKGLKYSSLAERQQALDSYVREAISNGWKVRDILDTLQFHDIIRLLSLYKLGKRGKRQTMVRQLVRVYKNV